MSAKRKYGVEVSAATAAGAAASSGKVPRVCYDEKSNFIVKLKSIFGDTHAVSLPEEPRVLDLYLTVSVMSGLNARDIVFHFNDKSVPEVCSVLLSTLGISNNSALSSSLKVTDSNDDPFRVHMDNFMVCGRTHTGGLSATGQRWDLSFTPGHPAACDCDCAVKTNRNIKLHDGFDLSILGDIRLSANSFSEHTVWVVDSSSDNRASLKIAWDHTWVCIEKRDGPWTLGEIHTIHFNPVVDRKLNASEPVTEADFIHFRTQGAPHSSATRYKQSLVLQFMPMSYTEQGCLVVLRDCVFREQSIDPLLWLVISYLFFPWL